jgi:hypothetical protein
MAQTVSVSPRGKRTVHATSLAAGPLMSLARMLRGFRPWEEQLVAWLARTPAWRRDER